jgi:hypothetical protein
MKFITEPKVHATEMRCYMRDPDGYLIEVGQTTMPAGPLDIREGSVGKKAVACRWTQPAGLPTQNDMEQAMLIGIPF